MFSKGIFHRNNIYRYLYFRAFHPKLRFSDEDLNPYHLHRKDDPCFIKYKTNEFEEEINEEFNKWADTVEAEYLIHYTKKCMVEPYYGWVLNEGGKVLPRSLPYMIDKITPLPHYIFYKRKNIVRLQTAVSMRYNWANYWHFFNDVIGQLFLLDKLNFDKEIPIIIPEKVLRIGYVKDFFNTGYAKRWKWIFQSGNTYYSLRSVYLCKSISNIKDQFLYAIKAFDFHLGDKPGKKIFITRNPSKGRNIINKDEIEESVAAANFEIIDCDGLSVQQQFDIFSSARVIIAIHGAGLTNMFFRYPRPCLIIELFPRNHYPTHYYWLARELGFKYYPLSGESNENGSFVLSKEKLNQILKSRDI